MGDEHLRNVLFVSFLRLGFYHTTKSIRKIIKFRRLNKFAFMSLSLGCLTQVVDVFSLFLLASPAPMFFFLLPLRFHS